jgi:hypothetical protein
MVRLNVGGIFESVKNLFSIIHKLFSSTQREASSGREQFLKDKTPKERDLLKILNKQIGQKLTTPLKYALNVDKQELDVLKKKERLSHNVLRRVKKFWRKDRKRYRELPKEEQNASILKPEERKKIKDEKQMMRNEKIALQHLQADEQAIEKTFKEKRKHDLKPLLKKTNHIAKIIIIEHKAGAVQPELLKQFAEYEKKLLDTVNEEEAYQQQVEKDEFKMLKILKSSLIKEGADLKKQLKVVENDEEKKEIKRRIKQVLGQIYVIDNTLHLAKKGDLNEEILRKKALGIYAGLEFLKKFAAEEQAALKAA